MRLEVTRKSDLALQALRALAAEPGVWKGEALAAKVGTTAGFLSQVMAPLVREGWVHSAVGPTGGYSYAAPRKPPSLLDLIEAVEGPTLDGWCVLRNGTRCAAVAGGAVCALHDGWVRAWEALLAVLAGTSALEETTAATPARQLRPTTRATRRTTRSSSVVRPASGARVQLRP